MCGKKGKRLDVVSFFSEMVSVFFLRVGTFYEFFKIFLLIKK